MVRRRRSHHYTQALNEGCSVAPNAERVSVLRLSPALSLPDRDVLKVGALRRFGSLRLASGQKSVRRSLDHGSFRRGSRVRRDCVLANRCDRGTRR